MNGRVTPTTGARPITIAMFTTTCQKSIAAMPRQMAVPKRSRACSATFTVHRMRKPNTRMRATEPTKPHSSARTGKMKSVCFSGR